MRVACQLLGIGGHASRWNAATPPASTASRDLYPSHVLADPVRRHVCPRDAPFAAASPPQRRVSASDQGSPSVSPGSPRQALLGRVQSAEASAQSLPSGGVRSEAVGQSAAVAGAEGARPTTPRRPGRVMAEKKVLNDVGCGGNVSPPAGDVSVALQRSMLGLRGKYLAEDGSGVDYTALAGSQEFADYRQVAGCLANVDLSTYDQQQRKAFFINVYNALTIHGLAVAAPAPPTTVLDLAGFWRDTCYNIGGRTYSLDDLEHGLLRGNRPHPSTGAACFREGDSRLAYAMAELDPRIHFALVCGAKSCPAVQVYSVEKLDRHLDLAARSFCSQEVELVPDKNLVRLSKIWHWYGSDFAPSPHQLLVWIAQYLPEQQSQLLQQMMSASTPTIQFKDYDWTLNKL